MRRSPLIFLSCLALGLPVPAQTPKAPATDTSATQRPEYRQAVQALRDRLPEVAATRLRKLLSSIKGPAAGPVKLLLAEALVRSGKGAEEALAAAGSAEARDLPDAAFWRGAALAQLQRFAEAEMELAAVPADSRLAAEASFSRASVLAALGQWDASLALLKPHLSQTKDVEQAQRAALWSAEIMLSAGRPAAEIAAVLPAQVSGRYATQFRYMRARLALAGQDAKSAAEQFAPLSEGGKGIPPALMHASALGRARALQQLGQKAEALGVVEKLIGLTPTPPQSILLQAFEVFERLNVPPSAEAENYLKIWAKSESDDLHTLSALAAIAAQEAGGRIPEALTACQALSAEAAQSPLLPWVLLREARLALAAGNRGAVAAVTSRMGPLAATPAVRAWASWLKASAAFDDRQFAEAAREFMQAANTAPAGDARAAAAFNSALAELQGGVTDPQAALDLIDGVGGQAARVAGAEFHLERSLYMAAAGMPGARDGLLAFVEALPTHPRRFQALTALAELAIAAEPPQPEEVKNRLAVLTAAAEESKDPAAQETAAWLKVTAAEKAGPPDEYAKAATAFLEAWPQSARRATLRMRLGEMYFRRQNFAAARQQFEQLAKAEPQHALAEAALFWAAKSALLTLGRASTDDAISLWEKVFQRNGPLKLEARLQVALLKQRNNDNAGALELLKGIMEAKPAPDAATRRQALCARGEILVAQSKTAGAAPQNKADEMLAQGLAAFDQVAADPQMPSAWKHEALVRKGIVLEQIKKTEEALEAWHTVLTDPPASADADDYWFHRAGEKVQHILETRGQFEEAVIIAEKMAAAPGPRAKAAAEKVNQLALKYGIWREMKKDSAPAPVTTPPKPR